MLELVTIGVESLYRERKGRERSQVEFKSMATRMTGQVMMDVKASG